MKKILLPVDFSEYSYGAVEYACQIITSNSSGQELDLIHVYTNHSNLYVNRNLDDDIIDPQIEISEREMAKMINLIQHKHPTVKINTLYRNGNLFEEISKETATFAYDAVVMGTKGSSGIEAVFLGSNTYDVILNTKTPVLGIPKEAVEFKKRRVGLLTNFKESEIEVLLQAQELIGGNFELMLVHVNTEDLDIKVIGDKFKHWIDYIVEQAGITDISFHVKSQALYNKAVENVSHAINQVIIDEQIDIILVTKSRKSIFRKLIDENIVRKMAYNITVPTFFARVHAAK
ncbi:universal stress protein [Sphingobacterium sp. JB170]|uniref:universal stress protein n=1 Tax=Sphingobacterium sp. JB170 TaxID=1434842 RepID=UPI00097EA4F9|nr:universal stress protein [Sphingobacterium sp. JB170]SJN29946.1 UspA [Sphingobacterium sp. JB170]